MPAETVRFKCCIYLYDCNTSCVYPNPVSLCKPISLSIIKLLLLLLGCFALMHHLMGDFYKLYVKKEHPLKNLC